MLQNFFPLYKYIRGAIIIILPISLILFSIGIRLPDAKIHKDTLKNSSFYTDLSSELKKYDPQYDQKNAYLSLVIGSTIDQFATSGWLQSFFEKNIDLSTSWLRGDTDDWTLFIPSQDVNIAITDKIDSKTKDYVDKYGNQIATCRDTEEVDLKTNGFESGKIFCLPKTVKDGKQTLSEFFAFDKNNYANQSFLNVLFKNSFFNTFTENFKAENVFSQNDNEYKLIKNLRDSFIWTRKVTPYILFLVLIASILLLFMSPGVGKKPLSEARRILTYSAYNTLIISLTIVLIVGGSSYLSSNLTLAFIPGLGTAKIASILTWQLTVFSFNIVALAIYTSLGFFAASILLWVIDKIGFFRTIKQKNQKLAVKVPTSLQNKTLDGEFRRAAVSIDPNSGAEFQNHDIIENFEMPVVRPDYKSVTFNYDAVPKPEISDQPVPEVLTMTKMESQAQVGEQVPTPPNSTTVPQPDDTNSTIVSGSNNGPKKNITWF